MAEQRYTKQFMVRISDELFDRINEDAAAQDRSMAYVARRILEDHYDVSSKKEILMSDVSLYNRGSQGVNISKRKKIKTII